MKIIEMILKGTLSIPAVLLALIGVLIGFVEVFIGLGRSGIKDNILKQIQKNKLKKEADGIIRSEEITEG